MDKRTTSTEDALALSKRHVAEQRNRIARQRELVAMLEADGSSGVIMHRARQLLREMIETLGRMLAEQRGLQFRLHSDKQPMHHKQADRLSEQ
jgi:hypothetical protein